MSIIAIAAVARNCAIGKGRGLPWHYSADARFFAQQTRGHACVMGYKTWLTLDRPLKDRLNIVLSRSAEIEPQADVILLRDRESVLSLARYLAGDLFIIGGQEIYRLFRDDIDRWLVTEIPLSPDDADTFMHDDFLNGFLARDQRDLGDGLIVTLYERGGTASA